jgi:hypothetical protein
MCLSLDSIFNGSLAVLLCRSADPDQVAVALWRCWWMARWGRERSHHEVD